MSSNRPYDDSMSQVRRCTIIQRCEGEGLEGASTISYQINRIQLKVIGFEDTWRSERRHSKSFVARLRIKLSPTLKKYWRFFRNVLMDLNCIGTKLFVSSKITVFTLVIGTRKALCYFGKRFGFNLSQMLLRQFTFSKNKYLDWHLRWKIACFFNLLKDIWSIYLRISLFIHYLTINNNAGIIRKMSILRSS